MGERRLYVFVDESGNPSTGDHYTLAATWCVSGRRRADHVLQSTIDRCLESAGGGAELKGTKLSSDQLTRLHSDAEAHAYDDPSVVHDTHVWESSVPFRYTLYSTPPAVAKSLIGQSKGRSEFTETFQAVALTAVLDPLLYPPTLGLDAVKQVDVVLDATTWDRAGTRVDTAIESFDETVGEATSVQTADSQSVPGLQLADITAYVWARNRRHGDCQRAANVVADRRLGGL